MIAEGVAWSRVRTSVTACWGAGGACRGPEPKCYCCPPKGAVVSFTCTPTFTEVTTVLDTVSSAYVPSFNCSVQTMGVSSLQGWGALGWMRCVRTWKPG